MEAVFAGILLNLRGFLGLEAANKALLFLFPLVTIYHDGRGLIIKKFNQPGFSFKISISDFYSLVRRLIGDADVTEVTSHNGDTMVTRANSCNPPRCSGFYCQNWIQHREYTASLSLMETIVSAQVKSEKTGSPKSGQCDASASCFIWLGRDKWSLPERQELLSRSAYFD